MKESKIDKITKEVGRNFRSFGADKECLNNPIASALKGKPLCFAAGVEVKSVVKFVLVALKKLEK